MDVRLPAVGLAAAAVLAILPAAATAAGKTVSLGPSQAQQKSLQPTSSDVDAFFPSSISVHVGQPVTFVPAGFHNVDLPARGKGPTPLLAPTGAVAAENDAAGAAFWFNGRPLLGFNPSLLRSSFGKTVKYSGARAVNSGLPLAERPKPVKVTFTKAGTYTYFCDIHPGMKGTVHVVKTSKRVPTPKADKQAAAKQFARALATAKALATSTAPAGTMRIGAAGPGGVERFAFVPDSLTVNRGTTVKFAMPPGSREDHTATAGPGDPGDEKAAGTYLGKLAASFQAPAILGAAAYPSQAPGSGIAALTPALHGNGFWNSGVLDTVPASPLPADGSVQFPEPGTFAFYCLIHPFMKATVTVK